MPPRDAPWPPPLHHSATAVTEEVAAADQGQPHVCPGRCCGGGSGGSCASASGSLAAWQPPLPLHEEEDPEYSDGQLGPSPRAK
eukprot:scaffold1752_cov136-Isochrysis_galbana.AAC.2